MKVKVLYFASFREAAGVSSEIIELDEKATIETLRQILSSQHPKLNELWSFAIFTVNRKYMTLEVKLNEGDEVGILPPISGG